MLNHYQLLLAAGIAIALPGGARAQLTAIPVPAQPEKVVEGATPDRVARIEGCQGHKFEAQVEVDPVTKRSTRVKLCADPGASDADWVNTLRAAIAQIERRDMPAAARDKLIAQLNAEVAKFAAAAKPALNLAPGTINLGGDGRGDLIAPTERFETSIVPPLPAPFPRRPASTAGRSSATGAAASSLVPTPVMRFAITCLARGESGAGMTCDYFNSQTLLVVSAIAGMEKGATLRFRRRGEARGEVALAPLKAGQSVRVRLPSDLCRGVSYTRVELELIAPGSATAVAARAGPYDMRC